MRRLLSLVLLGAVLLPATVAHGQVQGPDTSGPALRFGLLERTRDAIVDARRLRFTATADETATMRLKVVLRAPGRLVLSQFVDADVPGPDVRRVVSIRLTRTARRKLASIRKGLRLQLTGRARDAAGNETRIARSFRIPAR